MAGVPGWGLCAARVLLGVGYTRWQNVALCWSLSGNFVWWWHHGCKGQCYDLVLIWMWRRGRAFQPLNLLASRSGVTGKNFRLCWSSFGSLQKIQPLMFSFYFICHEKICGLVVPVCKSPRLGGLCCPSARRLPGLLDSSEGSCSPSVSPPPEERVVTRVWLLVFPTYYVSSFGILFVFFMRRNTARKTIIDRLFTLPGGEEDL